MKEYTIAYYDPRKEEERSVVYEAADDLSAAAKFERYLGIKGCELIDIDLLAND